MRRCLTFALVCCPLSTVAEELRQPSSEPEAGAVSAPAEAPPRPCAGSCAEGEMDYVMIERGRPRPIIDGVGWVLGLPNKALLWDWRADNHDVSPQTTHQAADYLASHDVSGVLVRVNQYDPLGEWRRLRQNERVGAGWRYTVGGLYTLGYTIAPGRLFGGDWYNPYTDTIHVYSDIPALALEQAAYAEDVHSRERPGGYAAVQALPLAGLWHESKSKEAVFAHLDQTGAPEEQAEARKVLYPQLGVEVGGQIGGFVPQVAVIPKIAGAAVGHVIGRREAGEVEQRNQQVAQQTEPEPSIGQVKYETEAVGE